MTRWGMTIDLNRCVGCQTCTIACKHANATPPGVQWRKVIDVEYGSFPDVERLFVVTGCQHCEKPPCVPVCPSGATAKRDDGLVTIDYDLCIGCASCVVACPYQARTIVHEREFYYGDRATEPELRRSHEERIGVANKCTFCIERLDEGLQQGMTPGIDMDATPACAASCIAQAITFGDFSDPDSNVSKLDREHSSFQMHAELGTNPQIKYLYEAEGPQEAASQASFEQDNSALTDASNPLVGKRQTYWDYRAAMNFALGGMASGLAIAGWVTYLFGLITAGALVAVNIIAAIIMAIGLFFVFLKLGRKARFLYVLLRPQTSWMTRETYCVGLFYLAVGAALIWPQPLVFALSGLGAAGFLIAQAQILYASKGIPSWRAPLVPWMLMATGLLEGVGLLLIILALLQPAAPAAFALALVGIALSGLMATAWRAYQKSGPDAGIGPLPMADISAMTPGILASAHALPAALFALSMIVPMAAVLGGLAAAAGGLAWKFMLITRACHQQGFALPAVPHRGSGKRAAPARFGVSDAAHLEHKTALGKASSFVNP
jgi:Fe-S-cluster-containing dehydrogenase component/DMSO reductase anchor subunit